MKPEKHRLDLWDVEFVGDPRDLVEVRRIFELGLVAIGLVNEARAITDKTYNLARWNSVRGVQSEGEEHK